MDTLEKKFAKELAILSNSISNNRVNDFIMGVSRCYEYYWQYNVSVAERYLK